MMREAVIQNSDSAMRRLVLVSPVPGMQTGTGNYLGLLARDLIARGHDSFAVVIDSEQLPPKLQNISSSELTDAIFGPSGKSISIIDYREYKETQRDLCIYFTANNEYHLYIYNLLLRNREATRVLVVHEPSCLMIACNFFGIGRGAGTSWDDFLLHLTSQYGAAANSFLEDLRFRGVAESLKYESFGFDWFSLGADEIIVHSEYARLKMLHELKSPHPQPKIVVRAHPDEARPSTENNKSKTKPELNIGVFGFVNPSKRVNEVISGLSLFVEKIGRKQAKICGLKLLVVGKMPDRRFYDPRKHATKENVVDFIEFYDYVDKAKFVDLLQRCDTIFNLRFPSCGETTGLSAFARPGLHIAVSDYHSFREVDADYLLRPEDDAAGVCDVLSIRYNALFRAFLPVGGKVVERTPTERIVKDAMTSVSEEITGLMNV